MSTPGAWTEDRIRALREKEDLPFVRADASGIVQEINDRFKAVYGWSEAALIGHPWVWSCRQASAIPITLGLPVSN